MRDSTIKIKRGESSSPPPPSSSPLGLFRGGNTASEGGLSPMPPLEGQQLGTCFDSEKAEEETSAWRISTQEVSAGADMRKLPTLLPEYTKAVTFTPCTKT